MNVKTLGLAVVLTAMAAVASAQSDARKTYIVELIDQPVASYAGGVAGYTATKPVAGQRLNVSAGAVQAYLGYLNSKVNAATQAIPASQVLYRYGLVLNGFAARLTDAELERYSKDPRVRAITADNLRPMDTSYTPTFLGLTAPGGVWSMTDAQGRPVLGEGVIIGHVDGGVWPEDRSFSDKVGANGKPVPYYEAGTVVYDPLPPGRYRGTCVAGLAFDPATMCNNKLIGAQVFSAGWKAANSANWAFEYPDSPRDADGHGSHTLSTSGGNAHSLTSYGLEISGMAPRARVAAYRVCFDGVNGPSNPGSGCYNSDTVAAINKAVADGVDVINFSVSGSQTSFRDAVEVAFFNAAAAGVFVSASAGNDGPANAVAHISPWLMTVANSTHDRFFGATVTLGSGATASGGSFQTTGLASSPLILATDAGVNAFATLTDADKIAQARCYNSLDRSSLGGTDAAKLDPAKVAGKIVVCYRGGNALVNKSQEVRDNGGVGAIVQNLPANLLPAPLNAATATTTPNVTNVIPAVHLTAADAATVINYAAAGGGTAAFSGGAQVAGIIAPQMAPSSSRGPNKGDVDIMKPDITAPGTDILAAVTQSVNAAQHQAIIDGTAIPEEAAALYTGTSMSSPHVAGVAALLRQEHPNWSPYAIKSALMTSALQNVKLANGAPDLNRNGYGSGHLNPNGAYATNLVYDTTPFDYLDYYNGAINSWDLNLASITRGALLGAGSVTRTVTNKGNAVVTYTASTSLTGFNVSVSPSSFALAPGQSQTFVTTLTRTTAPFDAWQWGELVWTGSDGSVTRSPLNARTTAIVASTNVTDTRPVGVKVFTVGTGFTGMLLPKASGTVPATRFADRITTGDQACFAFNVPAGTRMLRAQTFNSETEGGAASDLDLYIVKGNATLGASEGGSTDELVTVNNPAAGGDYATCVVGFAPANGDAAFVINLWVVSGTDAATLRAPPAINATTGGVASMAVSWRVPAGQRSLGVVDYRQVATGPVLGSTTVLIDNTPPAPAALAPVLRDKAVLLR